MRIDGALAPPGFIASAKMYTLIYKNETVYILFTGPGPAAQKDYSNALKGYRLHKGALENLAINALMNRYIKNIKINEERITDDNLNQLVQEKNCFSFSKNQISDFKLKVTAVDIRITFIGAGKKFKFDCNLDDKLLIDKFASLITN